jgi:hypothetical protein
MTTVIAALIAFAGGVFAQWASSKASRQKLDREYERILAEITKFVDALDGPARRGPATLLYHEGWLLRLVLGAAERGHALRRHCHGRLAGQLSCARVNPSPTGYCDSASTE